MTSDIPANKLSRSEQRDQFYETYYQVSGTVFAGGTTGCEDRLQQIQDGFSHTEACQQVTGLVPLALVQQ